MNKTNYQLTTYKRLDHTENKHANQSQSNTDTKVTYLSSDINWLIETQAQKKFSLIYVLSLFKLRDSL